MTVTNSREKHTLTAISTGGGIIEVTGIDGVSVSMAGDYYETLISAGSSGEKLVAYLRENITADEILLLSGEITSFVEIKSQGFLAQETIFALRSQLDTRSIKQIAPVLPVLSHGEINVPFITCAEMLAYNRDKHLDLWELAVHYECARGALSVEQVLEKMAGIIDIMQNAIQAGLAGTEYADRILGWQSGNFQTQHGKSPADRCRCA